MPPLNTPLTCLASGTVETDTSLDMAYSVDGYTCHTDVRGNPNQDCLNAMVALCSSESPASNPTKCRELIRRIASKSLVSALELNISSGWYSYFQTCFIEPNTEFCSQSTESLRLNAYISDISFPFLPENVSKLLSTGYISQNITDGIKKLFLSNLITA